MKVLLLLLLLTAGVWADAIDDLARNLSATHGLWKNGISPDLGLPQGAKTEEVLKKVFPAGYKLLREKSVQIDGDTYQAAEVQTSSARQVILWRQPETDNLSPQSSATMRIWNPHRFLQTPSRPSTPCWPTAFSSWPSGRSLTGPNRNSTAGWEVTGMRLITLFLLLSALALAQAKNPMEGNWRGPNGSQVQIAAGAGAFQLVFVGADGQRVTHPARWVQPGQLFTWKDKQNSEHTATFDAKYKIPRIKDVNSAYPDSPAYWYRPQDTTPP